MKSLTELLHYNIVKDNIHEILIQSTLDEYERGLCWYNKALSFCSDLSDEVNVPLINTIGVVSSLSPKCSWERNQEIARLYFNGIYKHTGTQIDKCKRIEKATKYHEISNILGGLKTRNFFGNILYPNDKYHVVIDTHVIKATTGIYTDRITNYQYIKLKALLQQAAKDYNMIPSSLQSILWLVYRDRKIKYFKQ